MLRLNVIFLALLQLVNLLSPLLVTAYTARKLGLDKYGLTVLIQLVMQYIALIANWGFDISATRSVANSKGVVELSFIFSKIWTAQWVITIISAVLVCLWGVVYFPEEQIYMYMTGFLYVIGSVLLPGWFLRGTERIKIMASVQMAAKIFVLPLYFIFVKNENDTWMVVLFNSLPALVSGVFISTWIVRKKFIVYSYPGLGMVLLEIKQGWKIFLSQILTSFYTMLTPIVLGFLSGSAAVGIFGIAEKIKMACIAVLSPIMQSIFPRMSILFVENKTAAIKLIKKVFLLTSFISLIQFVVLYFFPEEILKFVAGNGFHEAERLLKLFSFIPFLVVVSNICGFQILLPLSEDSSFLLVYKWAAVVSLVLMIPLIKIYGHDGAGVIVLVAEIISATGMLFFASSKLKEKNFSC